MLVHNKVFWLVTGVDVVDRGSGGEGGWTCGSIGGSFGVVTCLGLYWFIFRQSWGGSKVNLGLHQESARRLVLFNA